MYTTDLDVIRTHGQTHLFTWGEIIAVYEIGPYTIVEHYPWQVNGSQIDSGTPDYDQRDYYGYLNGKATSRSWSTLDSALAGLIAYRQEGPNSRAGDYFIKMLASDAR